MDPDGALTVDYLAGLGFLKWTDPRQRKLCLVIPITIDLLLLGFFKYADFGLDTARQVAHWMGSDIALPHLNIILPVGISFMGRAFSEPTLFKLAYAFEQAHPVRRAPQFQLGTLE